MIPDNDIIFPVQDAKVDKGSVHDVVLVGGSTRIPACRPCSPTSSTAASSARASTPTRLSPTEPQCRYGVLSACRSLLLSALLSLQGSYLCAPQEQHSIAPIICPLVLLLLMPWTVADAHKPCTCHCLTAQRDSSERQSCCLNMNLLSATVLPQR